MRNTSSVNLRISADTLGALGSAICALHCLLGPAFFLVGAVLPTVLQGDEVFHQAMLWWVVPVGTLAFALGCRQHKDVPTLVLGAAGLLGLLWSGTSAHELLGEIGERLATLAAACMLIAAHWRNFRLCRGHECHLP